MSTSGVSPDQILEELQSLESSRWSEVLDFIGYLKTVTARTQSHARELTARDLLKSGLVGMWANRDDIGDSLSFARRIRQQAEHRQGTANDIA